MKEWYNLAMSMIKIIMEKVHMRPAETRFVGEAENLGVKAVINNISQLETVL